MSNTSELEKVREKFPALQECIYANTAATGLLSTDLFEWRREHDQQYLLGGSHMKQKSFENTHLINQTVGDFFGCKKENVALVPNFSIALNLLLEGMPRKQHVLLLKDDYPSLNWVFETRNYERIYLDVDERLEDKIYKVVKENDINVLALSVIQWINGIKVDLDFLKRLKNEFPELMIIADGTQFCGTQVFDFEDSGIDILGASTYKWLLSGYGNAFVLVKDQIKQRFDLKAIGNGSVDRDITKRNSIPFCKHLEPGHLDSLNFGSLQFSLKFLQDVGLDKIEERLKKLSQKAHTEFSRLGLLEESVQQRKEHSTIFNIKGDQKLFDTLQSKGVVCAQRGAGIRLSFHFYNTEDEVDTIVDILRSN
ncbi:aminotransferase class V-fold PLP-dependent enzyme [Flagellimonas meridianipacifica]|uniref:Selenocysteine lyase/cysteine desulfurase n=1 Tax=Flagellimonas meridianipacifica TaxID=1080225 RepID=A0A2T0MJN6_9FLAO|nr:aminotransferase class V-fold PLP-dependent enzyme [Allomuricauda pacifica]PRX57794.1 selenocysteine lyase/cysteine desulfurase [Allomuricauda pacifica]